MHKPKTNMARISLLLILCGVVTQIQTHPQRGPPPPGYFPYGRSRSPPPPQTIPYSYGTSPQQRQFDQGSYHGASISSPKPQYQPQSPYYGASVAQPSYRKPPKSSGPNPTNIVGWLGSQMAKTFPGLNRGRYPTPQKYKQAHGRSSPPVGASSIQFGTPSPSGFGGGAGVGMNSITTGGPGQGVSHVYFPPGAPPTPHAGMTPQNTIFQVIAADGSSRYQAAPPPGYENFFNQGGAVRQALRESYSHQYQNPHPQPPPPQPQYSHQHQPPISYQYQQAPGQYPLTGTKSSGNIEVFPSQMVSYEKQTLSTGHPEYQAAVDGMVTAASSSPAHGYPVYYQLQTPTQQRQPLPQFYSQQIQQAVQQQQPEYGANPQVSSMLQGVSPDIAPVLDLDTLQTQQSQQDVSVASNPEPQVMEEQQSQPQQQILENNPSPSFLERQDSSFDYSQLSAMSVVPPPSNFQYQRQLEHPDLQGSESNNYQQVQIMSPPGGQSTYELMTDANSSTYSNGHPFDISQFIQQIEPGATVDPKDIVRDVQQDGDQSQAEAQAQAQGFQVQQQEYDRTETTGQQ